jgi:hypothetical protein
LAVDAGLPVEPETMLPATVMAGSGTGSMVTVVAADGALLQPDDVTTTV